jgi:hypothetical protein
MDDTGILDSSNQRVELNLSRKRAEVELHGQAQGALSCSENSKSPCGSCRCSRLLL